jgi:outer membrane cobalamin receptor
MKNTLLYIAIIFSLPLQGQFSLHSDTIKINEVVISRKKINPDLIGFKKITIDSSILNKYSQGTLADLLSESSAIFIKSYGMGGTATPSFRGTGASHTQVAWNGININHPMLGQSDLSLIPAGLIDDIQIYFGGASMSLNNGGIGGIINLETKPIWKKETLISINPGFGSFGRYSGLVKVMSGNVKFQTVTRAYLRSSENNFRYLNTESGAIPVWETRKNSQVYQKGFVQELYYRKDQNVASARIWYQATDRNLPATLLTQQPNSEEKQFDESLRTMLKYDIYKGKIDYFLTGAFLLSRLNYSNRLVSIDSRNLSETAILKVGMESRIDEKTKVKIVLNEDISVAISNNYDHNITRNTTSITATAERNGDGRIGTSILVREIFDNNTFLIPDFSAGLQFRLFDEKEHFLKANISRNSKLPTLNDLFWVPGGNPDLKNEYAFIYELTYEMKQKISAPVNIRYDASLFRNTIKDMIQWHPGEYSYWIADNIQNVNSVGLESSFNLDYALNNITSRFNLVYSFTKATNSGSGTNADNSFGKQLIYIPKNQINTSLFVMYRNFYSSWATNFEGKRYITVDNSRYLPGYLLNNIITGYKLKVKGALIDMNFNIDNLFNVNYQTIAYYPLPGRSYSIKLLIQILK